MNNTYDSAAAAVYNTLCELLDKPLTDQVNGMYAEVIGVQLRITNPTQMLIASDTRRFNYRYMTAEAFWNIAPRTDVAFVRRYFRGVDRFVEDQPLDSRHHAKWAYGPYLNPQFRKMLTELQRDRSSRRATATTQVWDCSVSPTGTPPCLTSVQWIIRDGLLHQITNMRSNDAWLGLPLDLYQFSLFQRLAAAELEVGLGEYVHNVGSLHLYNRDVAVAATFVNGNVEALASPPLRKYGMQSALNGYALQAVDIFGHERDVEDNLHFDYTVLTGMKEYAALLLGDYHEVGETFNQLRRSMYGVGW